MRVLANRSVRSLQNMEHDAPSHRLRLQQYSSFGRGDSRSQYGDDSAESSLVKFAILDPEASAFGQGEVFTDSSRHVVRSWYDGSAKLKESADHIQTRPAAKWSVEMINEGENAGALSG